MTNAATEKSDVIRGVTFLAPRDLVRKFSVECKKRDTTISYELRSLLKNKLLEWGVDGGPGWVRRC